MGRKPLEKAPNDVKTLTTISISIGQQNALRKKDVSVSRIVQEIADAVQKKDNPTLNELLLRAK